MTDGQFLGFLMFSGAALYLIIHLHLRVRALERAMVTLIERDKAG